jgi:methylenetetrahydrofolate dehydrogenase (NADP+) / methenyltetrahydrofolate cyclohydrolase
MTKILDGNALAKEIREEVAQEVAALVDGGEQPPGLAAVLVGDNPASRVYVRSKARDCEKVGIVSRTLERPAESTMPEILALIDQLNADPAVDGILVQLPLPEALDENVILSRVVPEKDVDGFHPVNVGRLWTDQPGFAPATPSGIVEMLRRSDTPLTGSHAVIVGRSTIVGKPMGALLLRENCTVTFCHSRTEDLPAICRQADILIAAIGRRAFFGPEFIREGATVVDVGINRVTDPAVVEQLFPGDEKRREQVADKGSTLVGDVDFFRVAPKAGAITPVPGGVGPLTRAMLLINTLTAARNRYTPSDRPEE